MSDVERFWCMAWDAYRLAIGMKPRTFTPAEVAQWIQWRALGGLAAGERGET